MEITQKFSEKESKQTRITEISAAKEEKFQRIYWLGWVTVQLCAFRF